VTIEINGREYNADRRFSIRQQSGSRSTSQIDVLVTDSDQVPVSLESVQIFDDATPIFFGFIREVDSPTFSSGEEVRRYRCSLEAAEVIFDTRLVAEAYTGLYTHEIVTNLFNDYISDEGITLGEISITERYYESWAADYLKLSDSLDELADAIGAVYFISPAKEFYFLKRDDITFEAAPTNITGLKKKESGTKLKTIQTIFGASEETSAQTASEIWVTNQTNFTVDYQISSIVGITINGNPAEVGLLGVDEADTDITFLYSPGSQIISVNANATTKPSASDIVVAVYYGYYNIIVTSENSQLLQEIATLNGTSGRREAIKTDQTIDNFADADALASNLLEEHSIREETINAICHDFSKSELYKGWTINEPALDIVGEYVIVERRIEDYSEEKFRISVKLKNNGLFSRYGTVLKDDEKKVRPAALIYKNAFAEDNFNFSEEYLFNIGDIISSPQRSGQTALSDPGLMEVFYPTL
jgi:hypothetical protein